MSKKRIDRTLDMGSYKVPLRVYIEPRSNVRASLGKDWIILRVPDFIAYQLDKHIAFTKDWLQKVLKKNPKALDKFMLKYIASEYHLTILEQHDYTVKVQIIDDDRGRARCKDNVIHLSIPDDAIEFEQRKMIRTLTSRIIGKLYKPFVTDKVHEFNNTYFQSTIKGVALKYNASNWGSCSSSGMINISTRSLLLPPKAFDYLIVHELAHTKQMNHSPAFWNEVATVMPDYELQETVIKEKGRGLDF